MQSSSSIRRKAAAIPWLAAILIGATAHLGWLIHMFDEPDHHTAHACVDTPTRVAAIASPRQQTYVVDRRLLGRVTLARELGQLEHGLGWSEPILLHNIRVGSPLHVLGLRTGDRLWRISTGSTHELDRVELQLERGGRSLELRYLVR